jgi:hypothetical protein
LSLTTLESTRTPPPSIRRLASLDEGARFACFRNWAMPSGAPDSDFGDHVGHAALAAVDEVLLRCIGRPALWKRAVISLASITLASRGLRPPPDLRLQLLDVRRAARAQQREPAPHQVVGDRHDLGEHGVRLFGHADVVVLALRHLVDAVQPFQQRHGQDALRLLAVLRLQVPAHEQVELLVGAAQFQVAFQRDRVVALHQGVEELVDRDRRPRLEALVEVVALHHPGHRVLGGQLDHSAGAQGVAPLAVVANFGLFHVQHGLQCSK